MPDINNTVESLENINIYLGQISSIVKIICCCFEYDFEITDYDNLMDVISEILNIQRESLSIAISDLMKIESYILDESKLKGAII